ncbi:response regulator transcription factor [Cryptosporangium phraense]|uniref:Response regulator n=1 Tax=Cryptosporangium phraense TaxID=2593070 RepID=A0A545AF40_9ACTN|nr:response regulator [Cryptosporangium phraense]TQS39941.1 response regulator [Cryptosporangium phraense]
MRVLVVDDDQDVCDLVVRCVSTVGCEVLAAHSGPAALTVVEIHGMPDVAVLDVAMPEMDGITLLGRLRKRRADLPAVFLSVLWSGHDLARMRDAGGVPMQKPFAADRLRAVLRELVVPRGRQAPAQPRTSR